MFINGSKLAQAANKVGPLVFKPGSHGLDAASTAAPGKPTGTAAPNKAPTPNILFVPTQAGSVLGNQAQVFDGPDEVTSALAQFTGHDQTNPRSFGAPGAAPYDTLENRQGCALWAILVPLLTLGAWTISQGIFC